MPEPESAIDGWNGRAAAQAGTPLPYPEDQGRTHWEGCWRDRGHHNCSVLEVERLRALAGTPTDAVREAAEARRELIGWISCVQAGGGKGAAFCADVERLYRAVVPVGAAQAGTAPADRRDIEDAARMLEAAADASQFGEALRPANRGDMRDTARRLRAALAVGAPAQEHADYASGLRYTLSVLAEPYSREEAVELIRARYEQFSKLASGAPAAPAPEPRPLPLSALSEAIAKLPAGSPAEPPPDHESFVEARASGFPALRRALDKRRKDVPSEAAIAAAAGFLPGEDPPTRHELWQIGKALAAAYTVDFGAAPPPRDEQPGENTR